MQTELHPQPICPNATGHARLLDQLSWQCTPDADATCPLCSLEGPSTAPATPSCHMQRLDIHLFDTQSWLWEAVVPLCSPGRDFAHSYFTPLMAPGHTVAEQAQCMPAHFSLRALT